MELKKELIMTYEVNQIHEACQRAGHTCDWEYFDKELKTYSDIDMNNLLRELIELEGEEGQFK